MTVKSVWGTDLDVARCVVGPRTRAWVPDGVLHMPRRRVADEGVGGQDLAGPRHGSASFCEVDPATWHVELRGWTIDIAGLGKREYRGAEGVLVPERAAEHLAQRQCSLMVSSVNTLFTVMLTRLTRKFCPVLLTKRF